MTRPIKKLSATLAALALTILGAASPAAAVSRPGYDETLPCQLQKTAAATRSCLLHTSPGYLDKLRGDSYKF